MTAIHQDFEMNVGETKKITVDETVDEDDGGTIDMSSVQDLKWVLKTSEGGKTVVEKTLSDSDITITDASVGAYDITIQPTDTENLLVRSEEEFFHKVRLIDGSGRQSDLLEGEITISKG